MKFRFHLLGVLALAAWLAGCSSSPSLRQAEDFTRGRIESESGGHIKLVHFKKTDGQAVEAFGVKGYRLDYEAEIEFADDGTWLVGMPHVTYNFSTEQVTKGSWAAFGNTMQGGRNVRKGEHAKVSGTLTAEKTENGWQFANGDDRVSVEPTASSNPSQQPATVSTGKTTASKSELSAEKYQGQHIDECLNNLRAFDTAKQMWALEKRKKNGDVPMWADLSPYAGKGAQAEMPVCPFGGTYTVNALGTEPRCSIHGTVSSQDPQQMAAIAKAREAYLNTAKKSLDSEQKLRRLIGGMAFTNFFKLVNAESSGQIVRVLKSFTWKIGKVTDSTNRYRIEYMTEVEFKSDGFWQRDDSESQQLHFKFIAVPEDNHAVPGMRVYRESRAHVGGSMTAELSENGWVIQNTSSHLVSFEAADEVHTRLANACIANLHLIDSAKQQWALELREHSDAVPSWKDLRPFFGQGSNAALPTCPCGGAYTINAVGERPQCSVEGHRLP